MTLLHIQHTSVAMPRYRACGRQAGTRAFCPAPGMAPGDWMLRREIDPALD